MITLAQRSEGGEGYGYHQPSSVGAHRAKDGVRIACTLS